MKILFYLCFTVFFVFIFFLGKFFFYDDFYYENISSELIGKHINILKKDLNIDYKYHFEIKSFIGYPYRTFPNGCGRGYSLTMYYNKKQEVETIVNKITYECYGTTYLYKRQVINNHYNYIDIYMWPIVSIEYRLH